jgi:hypothetical protein
VALQKHRICRLKDILESSSEKGVAERQEQGHWRVIGKREFNKFSICIGGRSEEKIQFCVPGQPPRGPASVLLVGKFLSVSDDVAFMG